jgi:hypothetical protein
MASKTERRGIVLFINGVEIENNVRGIQAEMKKTSNEIARMTIGTKEYQAAAQKLQTLRGIMQEHQQQVAATSTAVTQQSGAMGRLAGSIDSLPGPIGNAVGSLMNMGKAMWALVANPIGLTITAIVAALAGLYKAFTSTDTGAVAMAGTLKALGNIMDVLTDRAVSYYKMLYAIVTFDFKGMKSNAKDAFGGIGSSLLDAAGAGWKYAKAMDDIDDREVAAANRMTKTRVEIEKLKNVSKDQTKSTKERMEAAQQAMDKEVELNSLETKFISERNEVETMNLASKIQNSNLTMAQKEAQLKQWLAVDDLELQSLTEKDAAFADFLDKNEGEFQSLQKAKAAELMKEAELQKETRRLQTALSGDKKALIQEGVKAKEEAAKKELEIVEANNKKEIAAIHKRHLEAGSSEDQYNAELIEQELKYIQAKMSRLKAGSKEYEELNALSLEKQVKAEQTVKDLILKADQEFKKSQVENLLEGNEKTKAIEDQRWADELAALQKRLVVKEKLSRDEQDLNAKINQIIEEQAAAHEKKTIGLTVSSEEEKRIVSIRESILNAKNKKKLWEAELDLAKERYDQEFKAANHNRNKELDAEEKYRETITGIKREQNATYKLLSEEIVGFVSATFSGQLDEYASFGESLILVALGVLKQLIPIWTAQIVGGSLATPDSIMTGGILGIAKFTALLAIMEGFVSIAESSVKSNMNSKREKSQKSKGFNYGGYTGDGGTSEEAGIVHKGEYVIPQWMVKSPALQPLIGMTEFFRNNKGLSGFGLNPAIINIATPSPIPGRNLPGSDLSSIISDGSPGNEVLFNKSFDKINKTLERLNDHIEAGITTRLYAYGTGSVTEALEKAANFYKSVYKTKKW